MVRHYYCITRTHSNEPVALSALMANQFSFSFFFCLFYCFYLINFTFLSFSVCSCVFLLYRHCVFVCLVALSFILCFALSVLPSNELMVSIAKWTFLFAVINFSFAHYLVQGLLTQLQNSNWKNVNILKWRVFLFCLNCEIGSFCSSLL